MLRHPLSRFTKLHPQPWPASWLSGANRQLLTWHKDSTPDARSFLAPIQALLLPRAQGPPSGSAALRLRTTGAVACAWLGAGLSLSLSTTSIHGVVPSFVFCLSLLLSSFISSRSTPIWIFSTIILERLHCLPATLQPSVSPTSRLS